MVMVNRFVLSAESVVTAWAIFKIPKTQLVDV